MEAFQITTKVSRVGFDWPDVASTVRKLDEEMAELKACVTDEGAALDHHKVSEEIGDVLFALVNLARRLGVDPESSLKRSNRKFRRRFRHIEESLREQNRRPADADAEELMELWREAKLKDRN
jgi:ATP diphosphatase